MNVIDRRSALKSLAALAGAAIAAAFPFTESPQAVVAVNVMRELPGEKWARYLPQGRIRYWVDDRPVTRQAYVAALERCNKSVVMECS